MAENPQDDSSTDAQGNIKPIPPLPKQAGGAMIRWILKAANPDEAINQGRRYMAASYLTIVSGLPRSGTSMMMQVLCAGGLEALADHQRKADEDNPRGYYEFEAVKRTRQDPSWLMGSHGRVVKMVYRLLYDLPREYEYRVVFLRRDLKEVLASQNKMLQRLGRSAAAAPEDQMEELFQRQLADFDRWIAGRRNFSILDVEYKRMISDPRPQCEQINRFLDDRLNLDAMIRAVDPNLYRNRKG
jgi:hypothetical protein